MTMATGTSYPVNPRETGAQGNESHP